MAVNCLTFVCDCCTRQTDKPEKSDFVCIQFVSFVRKQSSAGVTMKKRNLSEVL